MNPDISNIKTICVDMVEEANSGHPGAPLGLSQFIHILYTEFINLNPDDTKYLNRDIFVLSNGHACAIQYVMNYLLGFLTLDDLKQFRKLNSLTPGHPEKNDHGIEISTGPLGQGVASSVGFAISSKILGKYGFSNKVYCIFGDGCYQEGISQEAFSLCAKLGLDNITFIYDFNHSTIDGPTTLSMDENVKMRFESLNYSVFEIEDQPDSIREALKAKTSKPKVIILHTKIAKDSEMEGSHKAHGSPLGKDNVKKLKEKLGIPQTPFYVSENLKKTYEKAKERMRKHISDNPINVKSSAEKQIDQKALDLISCYLKNKEIKTEVHYDSNYKSEDKATRGHLQTCINELKTNRILISGAADLLPCIKAKIENTTDFDSQNCDPFTYIRFGIREHAMFGVLNGMAAHGIFTPLGGTFLNFVAYGIGAVRIACIDSLKTIYILTHDSIKLGQDGATHQPVEVLCTLRAIPNLVTLRPCDGRETRSALAIAIKEPHPVALILSRQKMSDLPYTAEGNKRYCTIDDNKSESCAQEGCEPDVEKGAYYLKKEQDHKIILIATGSEVELAFKVKEALKNESVSVVSMISFELFERQSEDYKKYVMDKKALKVSIEAMSTFGWSKYSDMQIGLDSFGRSGPGEDVYEFFGFVPEKIADKIKAWKNK